MCLAPAGEGASLSIGSARIDFDREAWDAVAAGTGLPAPILVLEAFFDQSLAETLTYAELLYSTGLTTRYTNQIYLMNGPVVINQPQRTAQATTFTFEPGALPVHTGVIGLAGITRFKVASGGVLLFGDYTLQYDASRALRGPSGWYLRGNIPPAAPAFDLWETSMVETASTWQLSGRLGIGFEVANLLFATPGDAGRIVGQFEFTATFQPNSKPAPIVEVMRHSDGSISVSARGGVPGGRYTLQQANGPLEQELHWQDHLTTVFDAEGHGAPERIDPPESPQGSLFFRIRCP